MEEEGQGGARRRRGEGGFGWMDDRMAAFTQKLVSPAETHCSHSSATRPARPFSQLPFISASFGVLFLMLRAYLVDHRRTKRVKAVQRSPSDV